MSHFLTNDSDFAYAGRPGWHGLGTQAQPGWTMDQWLEAAGLTFTVAKAPVLFRPDPDRLVNLGSKAVTYREDNGYGLGVVDSVRYKIHQPREVVDTLFRWAAAAGVKIETMGSLKGGRRIWALARLDVEITLPGNDISRPYFLISTSYDGETATIGTFTMIRVVCWNTISIALQTFKDEEQKQKGQLITGFSIPHTQVFNAEQAAQRADQLYQAAIQYKAKAELLASVGADEETATRYFLSLVGSLDKEGNLTAQSRAKVDRMLDLYRTGPGADLKAAKGTVWGLLNAVTRWQDHEAKERGVGGRLQSSWFGTGKELKQDAMKAALELVAA